MKHYIFIFLLTGFLLGCSENKEPTTIEERVIMEYFSAYQAALAYDEVCNNASPKDRYDMTNPKNVNLLGNEQLLAGYMGGRQIMRSNSNVTVEMLVKRLHKTLQEIKIKATKALKEDGCNTPTGQGVERVLLWFSKHHPVQINSVISKEILSKGGTITSSKEVEAAGKAKGIK